MEAIQIQQNNFEDTVLKEEKPVLVDFFASWCGPCKMLSPVLDQVAGEVEGQAKIVKIDIDENETLANKYNIMSVPTLMVFKKGAVEKELIGVQTKENIIEALSL